MKKEYSDFLKTKVWKEFRLKIAERDNKKDFLTGSRLLKGFNCHHFDMNKDNYKNLNEEHFISLNKQSHEVLHFLYRYYQKDPDILLRLKILLDKMNDINN